MHAPMTTGVIIFIVGITLLGALSPLLTFTALFQQKEWRLDRLREHLRRDGWWNQLVGYFRGVILIVCFSIETVLTVNGLSKIGIDRGFWSSMTMPIIFMSMLVFVWIFFLALLSLAQIILHKQRLPVWTMKARLIVALTACIEIIVGMTLLYLQTFYLHQEMIIAIFLLMPAIVVLQCIPVLCVWVLLKPVDYILKKRVMDRAMKLRSQLKNVTVIGIAGSVGKTTVKELIAHLTQDLHPLVTPSHVNTEMGVAQWIINNQSMYVGARHAVPLLIVEMGAYRKGEIALLCRIAQPTIGVMTALGSDHVALFGSEEAIVEANGELIESLPATGHAFFYGNNDGCKQLAKKSPCAVTIAEVDAPIKHPLNGRHNNYNIALAVAVAKYLGITDKRIGELLATFKPQAHTFNVKTERGVTLVDDTYNISPLSLGAALDWAADRKDRPRVLLTSGLQETGADENRYLTELGTKASRSVERVIFTDAHGSKVFAKAFGKPIEILNKDTERVTAGSALLAVGRMPPATVQRLLPEHPHAAGMRLP